MRSVLTDGRLQARNRDGDLTVGSFKLSAPETAYMKFHPRNLLVGSLRNST